MTGSVLTLLTYLRWARSLRVSSMAMKKSKTRLSPLPGAPNDGDFPTGVSHRNRFEHRGLNTQSHDPRRWKHAASKQDEDTGSLPRFRPPCGVKPYSCLSGLHCLERYNTSLARYSTSVSPCSLCRSSDLLIVDLGIQPFLR